MATFSSASGGGSNLENLNPQIIRAVAKEIQELVEAPPDGIKCQFNEQNMIDIVAYIEGPSGTPYQGGVFRLRVTLSRNYPTEPPTAFFLTKIFHPNVAPSTGAICVNTLKKDWLPNLGIKHILLTIKCLLIFPNPESALNDEAGKLLLENYDSYAQRAQMMTEIHAQSHRAKILFQKNNSTENGEGDTKNKHSNSTATTTSTTSSATLMTTMTSSSTSGSGCETTSSFDRKKMREKARRTLKRL